MLNAVPTASYRLAFYDVFQSRLFFWGMDSCRVKLVTVSTATVPTQSGAAPPVPPSQ